MASASVTVLNPPTHTGPGPNFGATVVVLKTQPSQAVLTVDVCPAAVMVHPNGLVVVTTLVQDLIGPPGLMEVSGTSEVAHAVMVVVAETVGVDWQTWIDVSEE